MEEEKRPTPSIPDPSNRQLRETLESIRRGTNNEAIERMEKGLTPDPEVERVPGKDVPDVKIGSVEREKGLGPKEKEVPNPSNTELREALGSIWQATNDEAIERIKRGLTLEPEARYVSRDIHDVGVSPVEKKDGLDLDGYIKEWQGVNKFYIPNNIDLGETEIKNTSGMDIPFNFTDYLIGKAKILMAEKSSNTLNNIKQIQIRFRPGDKELIFMTKNDMEKIAVLSFQTEPPFGLMKVKSDLGIFVF